jgi:hypothetical protein
MYVDIRPFHIWDTHIKLCLNGPWHTLFIKWPMYLFFLYGAWRIDLDAGKPISRERTCRAEKNSTAVQDLVFFTIENGD